MVEAEYGIVREIERPRAGSSHAPESSLEIVTRAAASPRYGIEITLPGVCDRCVIKENCYGAGSMVWAGSDEALEPGDFVRLEMRPGTVLKATAWVYGIPLIAIVTGVVAGHEWFFASLTEQARVLLSVGLGAGLMGTAGWVLARLNEWAARRLTITARRAPGPIPA